MVDEILQIVVLIFDRCRVLLAIPFVKATT